MARSRQVVTDEERSEILVWTVATELLLMCLALAVLTLCGCPVAPGGL